jgi:hypothetical protein
LGNTCGKLGNVELLHSSREAIAQGFDRCEFSKVHGLDDENLGRTPRATNDIRLRLFTLCLSSHNKYKRVGAQGSVFHSGFMAQARICT